MAKKRKITAWVMVCLLWESVVVGVHIFMRTQLKFPTLNLDLFGWLIPVFMAVPFVALVLCVVSVHRKRLMKVFAVMFTSLSIVIYIAYAYLVCAFPPLYPLMSYTKNIEDYLVFDDVFVQLYDDIVGIIPETIPENATNVVYNYGYEPLSHGWLYVYWELPEDEYEAFKNETLQKDGDITQDSRGTVFSPNWNQDGFLSFWLELIFNDSSHSISCTVRQNYGCK